MKPKVYTCVDINEARSLARRAVACRGWRWMHGMSNDQGEVIDCVDVTTGAAYCGEWDANMTALPNLQDPATVGCLLALVREAWSDECAGHSYDELANGWFFKARVRDGGGGNVCILGCFSSEAEVLVAALEAAPNTSGEHRREEER